MKAVLDTKLESAYDDDIANRYHFPPRYLGIVERAVGDWAVFRRPRAGGEGIAYFAVGRIVGIEADPANAGFNYAAIGDFLPFDRAVAWRDSDGSYAEANLRAIANVPQVGLYPRGRSVRLLADDDFAKIVERGLADTLDKDQAAKLGLQDLDDETAALVSGPEAEFTRRITSVLLNRKLRDASFRLAVCRAYEDKCAVSGLRIVNGGGRSEVQAAHIMPVAAGGPDTVQNGIALSATAHWLFDRHLISIGDDYRLLVSHNKVPSELRTLFAPQAQRIILPRDRRLWPSQRYLALHRERFAGP